VGQLQTAMIGFEQDRLSLFFIASLKTEKCPAILKRQFSDEIDLVE
jgi:hypothetical protein